METSQEVTMVLETVDKNSTLHNEVKKNRLAINERIPKYQQKMVIFKD